MEQIIITGFGPFGPYKYNPTQDMVKYFSAKTVAGYSIKSIVLPTEYFAFRRLRVQIEKVRPVAIISTGLSSSVKGLRIETTGRNIMNGKYPDVNGLSPRNAKISQTGREFVAINTDAVRYANLLHENDIAVEISADAESYTCNALIYETGKYLKENSLDIKQFFLHTPWTDKYLNKIDLDAHKIMIKEGDFFKAIELIIENL